MPEWHLATVVLAVLSALGILWPPLLLALPLLVLAISASLVQAGLSGAHASFPSAPRSRVGRLTLGSLTAVLHVLQPLARLRGRLCYGLTPWRWHGPHRLALPLPRTVTFWSEWWQGPEERLQAIEAALQARGARVRRAGASCSPGCSPSRGPGERSHLDRRLSWGCATISAGDDRYAQKQDHHAGPA